MIVLCIVAGSCSFALASPLDTPLSQYDEDLLRSCLHGKAYEKAASIEIMGRILSPGLSCCLESFPEDVLEEPLVLSSIMRAVEAGGISGDDDLRSRLITRALCSTDRLVNNDAIRALRSAPTHLPFDAFWPPKKAPLIWGNPIHSRTVAPFLTDIDPKIVGADPVWEELPASLLGILTGKRGRRFRLSDYPLEIQLEIRRSLPKRENKIILRRVACSGRRDLVLPNIMEIVKIAALEAPDFRQVVPLLPDSMLFEILHDCPRTLIPVLVGECSRRGFQLSPAQLEGRKELSDGGKIPASSINLGTILETTMSKGNWDYFEQQLHQRRLGDTSSSDWATLYSAASHAELPPPEVRKRILANLAGEIEAKTLPKQTREIPPDLLYPRLLSGLLTGTMDRRAHWDLWLKEEKLFQDAEKILFLIGGRDCYAAALKRLFGRGLAERWLPDNIPVPGGVVEKLAGVQPPGDDIAGLALETGFPPLMCPPGVRKSRVVFEKGVLEGYGDPSNPRLARDFLINRLGAGDLGSLRLQHLAADSRPIISRFASRLLHRIPETGFEPFFLRESPQDRNSSVVHQVHILELLARLYQGLDRCMMKPVEREISYRISRFEEPIKIGDPPEQLLQASHPEMIGNLEALAAMGPTRRLRHAAQLALWTMEGDESIPKDWIREANGTKEARALEALDLLLAVRYRPAAKVFSSLLEDSRDAFLRKGLEGALVFSFKVPRRTLSVLAHHHDPEIARRAMLVLGRRQTGIEILLSLVTKGKPYTQRHAAEALSFFHSRKDIDRIAAALKECVTHEENCVPLFLAADRAAYGLGCGSPGATPAYHRMGPATIGRISDWLDWWHDQRSVSLEQLLRKAFQRGLEGLESQDSVDASLARSLLGLFVPNTLGGRREDVIEAAWRWYELGPSEDVFAWLRGADRHSFPLHTELLRALDEQRTENLVLREILRSTMLPTGRDAQNLIVEQLVHQLPNPFVGSCDQRAHNAEIWFRRVLDTGSHRTARP